MLKICLTTTFCCWLLCHLSSQTTLEDFLRARQIEAVSIADGLFFKPEKTGFGPSPTDGNFVLVRYKAMLLDSTVFDQSDENEPFIFQVGNREVIRGLDRGIRLLKKGAVATLFIPPSLGYREQGVPGSVPPNSALIYWVEVLDIMDFDRYDRYMRELEEKAKAAFEENKKKQLQAEQKLIEAYAVTNQLRTKRTESGLSYAITKPGKGNFPKPGSRITVAYEGFLLDGTRFDQSEQLAFEIGKGQTIQGWEEGLLLFNKGSEGWLLVPSKLGYGTIPHKGIPANSVLIFKVKILGVG